MFQPSFMLKTDVYKIGHWAQLPPETTNAYEYIESRGGRYGSTLFFGLQGFLGDHLAGVRIDPASVTYACARAKKIGLEFDEAGWRRIVTVHEGRLPLRVKALKEGSVVPTHVPLVTVENTDPELPWLPGWLETQLLRAVWYPTTVSTRSYYCKKIIHRYLEETSNAPLAELPFKLHDFGARGASSGETAMIGGAAHLVNFKGTDTTEGLEWMAHHYGDGADGIPGFSIEAMQHGTILPWKREGEAAAFRNMLQRHGKPGRVIACVSDTYDYWNAVENLWGGELREEVMASGATLVVRPDSGDDIPGMVLKTIQTLGRKIGLEKNLRGYYVLPSCFRVIQGDGNDDETSVESVLAALKSHQISASNIAFGMGGGLLQKLDRDTQRFAQKPSEFTVGGEVRPVAKNPKTDPTKASRAGRFSVVLGGDGRIVTVLGENASGDQLETVFENGRITREQDIDDVRKRAGREFV